ncbi:MAG: hypothetical protein LC679_17195 [Intrasporangiaceae bacterium]|nr:hypothetical protein [Intrasporangiaceae bacterium]
MAVLLAQVLNVRPAGFEDPQPEQTQHRHQREVVDVGGLPGGGEHRLELQVGQAQGGRLGRDVGPANVLGWGVRQDLVDHAGPVEPGHDRDPAADRGRLVPAHFLHPPHIQLDVGPLRGQRVQAAFLAPGDEGAQVGLAVHTRLALEPGQVGSDGATKTVRDRRKHDGNQNL